MATQQNGSDIKALAKQGVDTAVHDTAMTLSSDVIASLVLNGDLGKLTPMQKVNYYNALCERVGLDPATQPFKLLKLNGKEVMYADKGATQQLSQRHQISHDVVSKERDEDIYTVTIKASLPGGRYTVEDGCVNVQGKKGDDLANAKMKAMTKAKRRAVLALLGLGMTDESELDTMPGAEIAPFVPVVEAKKLDAVTEANLQTLTVIAKELDAELVNKKPVEQSQTPKTDKEIPVDDQAWFGIALSTLGALGRKGGVEAKQRAAEWGIEARVRLQRNGITQAQFDELAAAYRKGFPPAPAPQGSFFDEKGKLVDPPLAPNVPTPPTPEQQVQLDAANKAVETSTARLKAEKKPSPAPKPEPKAKGKGKKGASPSEELHKAIAEATKLSVLFTIKGRIEKSQAEDKAALLGELNAKLATVKGAKK